MTTSSLYGSSSLSSASSTLDSMSTLSIVAAVVGICGAITLVCTVLNKKNQGKAKGALGMLYDTFTFRKMWLREILEITYLMATIYITIMSFGMIQLSWKLFFVMLIGGNLLLRMGYEASLMFVGMYENLKAMNMKMQRPPVPPQRPGQPGPGPRPVQQQPVQRPVEQPQPQQPVQQPVEQAAPRPEQPQQ